MSPFQFRLPEQEPEGTPAEQAIALFTNWQGAARRIRAHQRYLIYKECYHDLILERVVKTHSDDELKRELVKFIDVTINPAVDITRQICVVWKRGARRILRDVKTEKQVALSDLLREGMLDMHISRWNQMAFLLGPIIVVPIIRKDRLIWDVLLPHLTEVVPDPDNPQGPPLAAAWKIEKDSPHKSDAGKADTVVLDATGWHYYSTEGAVSLVRTVPHDLGEFPGAVLRFGISYDDWWCSYDNQRLVDGTIAIGVINATLAFTRKAQNKKLAVIIGDTTQMPKGQRLDPEIPLQAETESPNQLNVQTLDFDTDPGNFIKHALWIQQSLAEAYGADTPHMGGGPSVIGLTGRFTFTHEALTEIRNEQIVFARMFEHDLIEKSVKMARSQLHPQWPELPTPEEVEKGYSVQFPKLARSYSDPKSEADHTDWLLSKGAISQLDIMLRENPTLTDEQLLDRIMENLEVQSKINDEITKRNLAMSAEDGIQTASQAFGRLGPMARDGEPDGSRNDDDDRDEERDDRRER